MCSKAAVPVGQQVVLDVQAFFDDQAGCDQDGQDVDDELFASDVDAEGNLEGFIEEAALVGEEPDLSLYRRAGVISDDSDNSLFGSIESSDAGHCQDHDWMSTDEEDSDEEPAA